MDRKEIEMLKRSSDEAFKELMHDRDVLAWTALAVVDEFRNMKPEQVKSMMCDDGDRARDSARNRTYRVPDALSWTTSSDSVSPTGNG